VLHFIPLAKPLYISYSSILYGDIMSTTIALKDDTYFLLKMMKSELATDTYDETIQKMISKIKKPRKSYLGKFKGMGEFKREEIDRFA
jgi:predicted CopG family antitoxin